MLSEEGTVTAPADAEFSDRSVSEVRRSPARNAWRRLRANRLALVSLIVFAGVVAVAVFAPLITGASPTAMANLPLLPPSGAPIPPAPVGVAAGAPPRGDRSTGLDNWIERLFGHR